MQRNHILLTTLGGLVVGALVIGGFLFASHTERDLPAQEPRPQVTRGQIVEHLDAIESAQNSVERWNEMATLAQLGPVAAPLLLREIDTGEYGELTHVAAYRALHEMGETLVAADRLIEAAIHFDSLDARRAAAHMLPDVCSMVHEPRLKRMLGDGDDAVFDEQIQVSVARALWFACRDTRTSIPHLRRLMNSALFTVRMDAMMAYAEIGRYDEVEDELRILAAEPSDRGRMARQLRMQMRLKRQLERIMLAMGGGGERIEDPTVSLSILREVVLRVRDMSAVDTGRLTTEQLLHAGADRMLDALDPYAAFLPSEEHIEAAEASLNQLAVGEASVGLVAGRPGGLFRVIAVLEGSSAQQAGLEPGDTIFEIDGEEVHNRSLVELNRRLQGDLGDKIDVQVARAGWSVPRTFHLEVREVEPRIVRHAVLPGGIGYVYAQTFVPGTADELRAAVAALQEAGAESLVLDVRSNPGGDVGEAVQSAGLFLPEGTLVTYSKGRNPEVAPRDEHRTEQGPLTELPLVVLVDRGTAGAAEILAGALQAHDRAELVAELREIEAVAEDEEDLVDPMDEEAEQLGHTFGLAQVQAIVPIRYTPDDSRLSPEVFEGSAIKLTTAFYYLPNDERIQNQGLVAEHTVSRQTIPGWILDEIHSPAFYQARQQWLREWMESDRAGLVEVVEFDERDPAAWKGLAELIEQTENMAPIEWARRTARHEARQMLAAAAQDAQEAVRFRLDLQDDRAAFEAVAQALAAAGGEVAEVPEYRRLQDR